MGVVAVLPADVPRPLPPLLGLLGGDDAEGPLLAAVPGDCSA